MHTEKLLEYLQQVDLTFYINEDANDKNQFMLKPHFLKSLDDIHKNLSNWKELIISLRNKKVGHIKNMETAGQLHSFTGILIYNDGYRGIIFNISFPFRLYGFYYSKIENSPNEARFVESISYLPFDNEMENLKFSIEKSIIEYFPHTTQFDNSFAQFKIKKIFVANTKFEDIDLYTAIFSTNSHGIV